MKTVADLYVRPTQVERKLDMPIICLEGPSAVGKTSTAHALAEATKACVIPEVNELFERPVDESRTWYFERQVDRWRMTTERPDAELIVLDGDPFQPIWYNWVYRFDGWEGIEFLKEFYRSMLVEGRLEFPHLYFVLSADIQVLRERKKSDATRQRRNFERHLQLIEPQLRYFEAMRSINPERVHFLESGSIEESVQAISAMTRTLSKGSRHSVKTFDHLVAWLQQNSA